jgi:hypothetical protein
VGVDEVDLIIIDFLVLLMYLLIVVFFQIQDGIQFTVDSCQRLWLKR